MTVLSDAIGSVTDEKVRTSVMQAIGWRPDIRSKDISVKVSEGVTTLTGFVHSYIERVAAENAAAKVHGVQTIVNDIEVRPAGEKTDPELARDAMQALKLHSSVPDDSLKISVAHGCVTLNGSVEWEYQRRSAQSVIETLSGVRGVVNLITLVPKVSAQDLRARIERALRNMVTVDASGLQITAADGTVTLSGRVRSWIERSEAEYTAWQAPGVRKVVNQVTVMA